MTQTLPTPETLAEQFGRIRAALPGADVPWLDTLREDNLERFAQLGWPTAKTEAWKYTSLKEVESVPFGLGRSAKPAQTIDVVPCLFSEAQAGPRLVFVNGHFNAHLSVLKGLPGVVVAASLAEVIMTDPGLLEGRLGCIGTPGDDARGQPLLALNTAFMNDGFVIVVGKGVVLDDPIEIVFIGGFSGENVVHNVRNLIVLEDNSRAVVVENYVGFPASAFVHNEGCEVRVGPGAALKHYKLQTEGFETTHLNTVHVDVERDAAYETFMLATGARLTRNEKTVRLKGEGAHCAVNGAFLLRGSQHCDNTTVIEHTVPNTTSREVFKGALDGESRGVFQGRIVVHKGAQKTDGHQMCKALLLSDK
ncbi:MAG: SufD family Fe-S cluster assembly protein, partial [Rhodospirillales bacterium]